jgi:hypothetical protein
MTAIIASSSNQQRMSLVPEDNEQRRPEDLLDSVSDRSTFIEFVSSLASERERAAQIEKDNPNRYILDGAINWKNGDIHNFLFAALEYFDDSPLREPIPKEPTWKMFADFLYCGKIME